MDVTHFCFFSHCGSNEAADFLEVDEASLFSPFSLSPSASENSEILENRITRRKRRVPWNKYESCPLTRHTCPGPLYE